MQRIQDLLTNDQCSRIKDAPLIMGGRHPTWYPIFYEQPRAIDYSANDAVSDIAARSGGDTWLRDLVVRLMDLVEINNASSALAEIRAYGGFLKAGFKVIPILRRDDPTPDFEIDAGDGLITVEVFSKHQDKEQDELLNAFYGCDEKLPPDVERTVRKGKNSTITTTMTVLTPAGKPDSSKPYDSVQANMISRLCNIKQNENQLPDDKPALLVIDIAHFGGAIGAKFLKSGQAAPIESGHHGLTCGSLWYALYGWKNAPIFEEGSRRLVRMGHDGRFRLLSAKKTKLSAVLVVLAESAVLLENPWATYRIPNLARLSLCSFPWFDLTRSIADWQPGDAEKQIAIHRSMIETIDCQLATNTGSVPD